MTGGTSAAGVGGTAAGQPAMVAAGMGGAAGAASLGGGSSGSSGVAMDCSSYRDAAGWTLLVTIKNEMTQTLYLGQDSMSCDVKRLFEVEDGARTLLPSLDGCHTSCQAMMQGGAVACPEVCAMPSTVTLQPGETIQVPWDGRFAVAQTLPQQCLGASALGPASCVQAQQVEASAFSFVAQAGTQRSCLQPGGTCTCTPNQNGGCTSPASLIGGTIYTSEYFVKLEPGELSPAGEPQYIGILFRPQ